MRAAVWSPVGGVESQRQGVEVDLPREVSEEHWTLFSGGGKPVMKCEQGGGLLSDLTSQCGSSGAGFSGDENGCAETISKEGCCWGPTCLDWEAGSGRGGKRRNSRSF